MLLSETDYDLYVTFYLHNVSNGTETRVLALYGTCISPNPTPSPTPARPGTAPEGRPLPGGGSRRTPKFHIYP